MISGSTISHAQSLSEELGLALSAANAAGKVIAGGYGKTNRIQSKDLGDLVSEIDLEADRIACEILSQQSDFPIVSEELHSDSSGLADTWIVDPLDASNAFLMQAGPQYPSVLIALQRDHQTRLGVVYFPITGEVFYAQFGRGAWHDGKRLICAEHQSLDCSRVEMNHYGKHRWETEFYQDLWERLRSDHGAQVVTSNLPYSGVAVRIAQGVGAPAIAIHDNNPDHPKQGPWDIAAPQIVLEEAGGVFLNPKGQRTNLWQPEPIIVARSEQLGRQVLDLATRNILA